MIALHKYPQKQRLSASIIAYSSVILHIVLFLFSTDSYAQSFPETKISNGIITAKIYLPDTANGYYRSTRFDWSGAVYSLQYKDHDYYGTWYDRIDPKIINWVFEGDKIVAGPCSGLCGPVNEFQTVLGWDDAEPETFIKIGVGVLRRSGEKYNRYAPYEIVNSGKWSYKKNKSSVEFVQELSDPASGYGYIYHKIVRFEKDKPVMIIEQSLKNTGRLNIASDVYNHNFVVLDRQAPGPDFTFKVPFKIQTPRPPDKELIEVQDNNVVYMKYLSGENEAVVIIQGFSDKAEDNEVIIENRKVGAGLKITCNRPLIREILWSIRTVLAIEPYISINIKPGDEFTWENKFEYYTLPYKN